MPLRRPQAHAVDIYVSWRETGQVLDQISQSAQHGNLGIVCMLPANTRTPRVLHQDLG